MINKDDLINLKNMELDLKCKKELIVTKPNEIKLEN